MANSLESLKDAGLSSGLRGNSVAKVIRAKLIADGHYDVALRGRCMEPLLCAGDVARIVSSERLRVGDIALIDLGNGAVALHRVVEEREDYLISKGDYSGKSELVLPCEVIGVAREFRLEGKGWARDPRGRDEILALVELSLGIIGRRGGMLNEARRREIWEANLAVRRDMLNTIEGWC